MKIIISPTKTMEVSKPSNHITSRPFFLKESTFLYSKLKSKTKAQLQEIYNISDKLLDTTYQNIQDINIENPNSLALFSFKGQVFKKLNALSLNQDQLNYLNNHLYILSGLYGVLKPFDEIINYRLDLENNLIINNHNLYDFWQSKVKDYVTSNNETIINLASKEYSRLFERYLNSNTNYITITFLEHYKGKLVSKSTNVKIARGEMLNYLALNQIQNPQDIKLFNKGYHFDVINSSKNEYIFIKD